ncbi:DNA-binding IclR family transcriptional regulator [Amycolatopsis bartoniae]|uniref:IclR family transcriptional regulator n=1 Tax=Amycolatopsis bartoniae TaxID=941986 RepID=A0A8H9ISR6_9PSEU|nr:IclR family transcriptional regulator [Amycolatopsis bartoniae]MBB2937951.1 DNA-binding IclR family transcriptional regulator [Amycolatopsis bartoniae]TVT08561.1 IclR family transcriptional regulator [Amycolatopsis bartoniae]GHF41922.1 IclR family transcriptional regulator [Amycolatopsis bartoniae]
MKRAGAEDAAGRRDGASTESGETQGVRSVQRALDILGLLTETQPTVSISDIVRATGLAKTTAIRLAQTLEQNGLLWATNKGYMAGPGLWRWAHLARQTWELPAETKQLMRDLGDRQRETVNLYVLRDVYRVCVAQQESPQPLRHVVRVGDELPLWGGASSKVLLRDASPALLARIARSSPYGAGHADALRAGAEEAAAQGFAVSHGEREQGLSAVAVPLLGRGGTVVAALSLSGPSVRFPEDKIGEFVADLTETARRMTERGFDHPFAG